MGCNRPMPAFSFGNLKWWARVQQFVLTKIGTKNPFYGSSLLFLQVISPKHLITVHLEAPKNRVCGDLLGSRSVLAPPVIDMQSAQEPPIAAAPW